MKSSPRRSALTFLLFILVCIFTGRAYYPLSVLSAVFIHETGHMLTAKAVGIPLWDVRYTPFGIRMRFDISTAGTVSAVAVYLSGSLVSIICGAVTLHFTSPHSRAVFAFALISLTLGLINLMPVRGLDGGCILEHLLSAKLYPDTAYRAVKAVSDVFVFFFWFCALYVSLNEGINVSMITLSVYLILASL